MPFFRRGSWKILSLGWSRHPVLLSSDSVSFTRLIHLPMIVSDTLVHALLNSLCRCRCQEFYISYKLFRAQSFKYSIEYLFLSHFLFTIGHLWNAQKYCLCIPLIKMSARGGRGYMEDLHKFRWEKVALWLTDWTIYLSLYFYCICI